MDNFVNHSWEEDKAKLVDQLFQEQFERGVLSNGMTLLHLPDFSSELVSVQVWVKTGSIHEETLSGSGLSHFLEHLLFKGTERREGKQISRELNALGADMNAYTTFDHTVYYIDAPSSAFAQVVELLCDCVLHSVLPAGEIESERDVILREIDMDLDDPDRQLSQALFRTAFRVHPYREPVIGHRNLFEQIKRDELLDYYRTHYVPNNMVLSIVGAVGLDECKSAVKASFGQVPRGRLAAKRIPEEPMQLSLRREAIRGNYAVSRGSFGFKSPCLSHRDSPALDLLAYILGAGESSLLWEQLRNKKRLVNYIDCCNWNPDDAGLFEISYICDHNKQSEVEPAIFEVFNEVCDSGLTESMLQKARAQMLKDEINRRKTISGKASRLGFAETVIGDIGYGYRYFKQLQTTRLQDVQAVAERYLVEERMSSAVLRPEIEADGKALAPASTNSKTKTHELIQFASGARLLLQKDTRLPKVHIRCVMLGGPAYEPVGRRGISELLAELLTKDTAHRSASEVSMLVDRIGGSFTTNGGNNTISLAMEVLPSDIDIALELLSDALTCPTFEVSTFQTELEGQISSLKEEEDDIFDCGFRALRRHFFGKHPLAIDSSGQCEDLELLTLDDLKAHFRRLVTAPNIVISVVGDFEQALVVKRMKRLLESEIHMAPFEMNQAIAYDGPAEALKLKDTMDREQAVLFQAYPDVGICSPDYLKGELLNELLNGMSSRLFERVREDRGLAYFVGTSRTLGLQTGMFTFYAGTHSEQTDEVAAEIDVEIARVKAGQVTEEELQHCRTRLKASRLMANQTIDARALDLALKVAYGLPIESDAEYAKKLDQVKSESIAKFANTFLNDENSVRLIVGP